MADFDITAPDGRKFRVSAPEGATQEQVLAYANEQLAKMPPEKAPEKPGLAATAGAAAFRGLMTGGPMGIPAAMAGEGMKQAGEILDKAAYGAGGYVTDKAAKVLPAEAAAGLGFATNVATQAVPTLLGGQGAKLSSPAFRSAGEHVMQSALKPTLENLRNGNAARAITTMLEEGINVTKGGVQKLRDKISELNAEITRAIIDSPATVHKGKVASELSGTLKKFEKQVNPAADVKAIESAWTEFMSHPLLKGDQIPVQVAQELKQGTYKVLAGKYGEQGSASTEAQKALARGLKEGVAEAVPGVGALNAQESKLINALNLAERRSLMELNKNPAGLSLLAKNPEAAIAFMADRSAVFKSLVARLLYQGSEQIPANVARILVGGGVATNNLAGQQQ